VAQSAERATRPRKIEGDFWMAANVPYAIEPVGHDVLAAHRAVLGRGVKVAPCAGARIETTMLATTWRRI